MDAVICACGCGTPVKCKGAKFAHGHHLRLKEFQRKPMPAIQNTCKNCGVVFVSKKDHRYKQQFCSRECSIRNRTKDVPRVDLECRWCHGKFQRLQSLLDGSPTHGKYCCNECRLSDWRHERLSNPKPGNYRANAYEIKGVRHCESCGYSRVPEILVVHHKDGNRENGVIENLEILCPTCHAERHFLEDQTMVPTANHASTANSRKRKILEANGHPNSKLTPEKVLMVVDMAARGTRGTEIARELGASPQVINMILRGRTWSWLTGIEKASGSVSS